MGWGAGDILPHSLPSLFIIACCNAGEGGRPGGGRCVCVCVCGGGG